MDKEFLLDLKHIIKVQFVVVQLVLVLVILFLPAFGMLGLSPSPTMSPPSSFAIVFITSRTQAYYLMAIPDPNDPHLLSFYWNVSAPNLPDGTGSVQFSHDEVAWANLVTFNLVSGEAQGKQAIDSSWASPGPNYLRVSYWVSGNQSLSEVWILEISINYAETMLLSLLPFVVAGTIVAGAYLLRKRNRQSAIPTP